MTPPACAPPFEWMLEPWGWTLTCRALAPWHGWTSRRGQGGAPASPDWTAVAARAGVPPEHVLGLQQVHGADVVCVSCADRAAGRAGDALLSNDPQVILSIRVADCVPILVSDRATGAVAAVHAGWRGTCAGIAGRAVDALRQSTAGAGDVVAALGPSIGPCCYQTGEAVRAELRRAGWESALVESWFGGPERRHLDLWRANEDQLIAAGVRPEAVFVSRLCTACHPEWFHSYRRDGERAGRMGAYVRAAGARW